MKIRRALVRCGAFLGAGILVARADGGSTAAPAPAAPKSDNPGAWMMWVPPSQPQTTVAPEWNGATGSDVGEGGATPEGTDASNTERVAEETYAMNQEKQQHPEDTLNQTATQQAYDQDWMLRTYTQQLKKRHLEKADYTNPYLSPAPTPLAVSQSLLSDDPLLDQPDEQKEDKPVKPAQAASDIDNEKPLTPRKPLTSLTFQPLLGAFGSTPPSARPDATGDLASDSAASLLPVPDVQPSTNLTGLPDTTIPSMLDVPGLTAASQGGLPPNTAIDFADPGTTNHPHRDTDFLVPTAPGSDVTEFFKNQAKSLAPPIAYGAVPLTTLPPKPRVIIDPEPMAKPAISGIRSHIDDPFDILQR